MTDENRSIFRIIDKIIEEVNKTKTIFTILIVLIIIPLGGITMAFVVFDLAESDYYFEEGYVDRSFEEEYPEDLIFDLYLDVVLTVIIFVVIGFAIRQLAILNRWTKKYQNFKNKQQEMEEKTDDELDEP